MARDRTPGTDRIMGVIDDPMARAIRDAQTKVSLVEQLEARGVVFPPKRRARIFRAAERVLRATQGER